MAPRPIWNAVTRPAFIGSQMKKDMPMKTPSNEAMREKDGVIDQRQQQIDPAGKHRHSPNDTAKHSQK